jgi:hypothetical protein
VTDPTQDDAPVRNHVGMPTTSAPGGNVYVGDSLTKSLLKLVAGIAAAPNGS